MRKWRPTHKCTYVIPEIHGSIEEFKILLNRIVPLRFSIGQEDSLVFLGDFIGNGTGSAETVELILTLKEELGDSCIFISGNNEDLFLKAFESEQNYQQWLVQGGMLILQSYLDWQGVNSSAQNIPFSRLTDIIPETHLSFFKSLPSHKTVEDYVFFHGGLSLPDPSQTTDTIFIHDTNAAAIVQVEIKKGLRPLKDSGKVYVGCNNRKGSMPFIYANYFMLGGSAPKKLVIFELNSMSCAAIKQGNSRIYKHKFKYVE